MCAHRKPSTRCAAQAAAGFDPRCADKPFGGGIRTHWNRRTAARHSRWRRSALRGSALGAAGIGTHRNRRPASRHSAAGFDPRCAGKPLGVCVCAHRRLSTCFAAQVRSLASIRAALRGSVGAAFVAAGIRPPVELARHRRGEVALGWASCGAPRCRWVPCGAGSAHLGILCTMARRLGVALPLPPCPIPSCGRPRWRRWLALGGRHPVG